MARTALDARAHTRIATPRISVSQVRLQELNRVTRYETKQVVLCLIARELAEWVVRGVLAREKEPPKVSNGWLVRGTYKQFNQLQTLTFDEPSLPSAELPGLKFEEPRRRRREIAPCALVCAS